MEINMLRQINGVATIKKVPFETGLYMIGSEKSYFFLGAAFAGAAFLEAAIFGAAFFAVAMFFSM
jgi:hypothetical protein